MTNEYGVPLDRNGYAPSIIDYGDGSCYICRKTTYLQRHEIFHGSNRAKSKAYGLWVNVCYPCHTAIHNSNGILNATLKVEAQKKAQEHYHWQKREFISRFGKSYG